MPFTPWSGTGGTGGGDQPYQFRPETYGALGNGRAVFDVVTNGTTTITSATANFTSADAGKSVLLNGANGVTGAALLTTVASVSSATTVVLAAAAGASASGVQMVIASDDTAAINACVTAASAYALANNYFAQVLFGAKIYGLASATTRVGNGTSTPTFNAQIPVPYPAASGNSPKLVFEFVGVGSSSHAQMFNSSTPSIQGTCLVSMITVPSAPDPTFGIASVIGGPTGAAGFAPNFANNKPVVRNLTVWCPILTNLTAFDFSWCSAMEVNGSSAQIFAPANSGTRPQMQDLILTGPLNGSFTATASRGLRSPVDTNNDNCLAIDYACEGYLVAAQVQDHFVGQRMCCVYNDVPVAIQGLGPTGVGHEVVIDGLSAEAFDGGILLGGAFVTVYIKMDAESAGPNYDVSDTGNAARGEIRWSDTSRTAPVVNGGSHLRVVNDAIGPGHMASPPAVPATTVAAALQFRDATVKITTGVGVTVSAVTIDGTATGQTMAASSTLYPVRVPLGKTIALTYAGGTPSWDWWLD